MTHALITPEQLTTMGDVVIIDTRAPEAYAAGHIPGAVNLHEIFTFLATSDPDGIVQMTETFASAFGAAGLSGKETAVIYEGSMNTGFGQSCRGYFLLDFLGYPKKAVLDGGIEAWVAAGLPLNRETVAPEPVAFPVDPAGAHVLLTRDDMLAAAHGPTMGDGPRPFWMSCRCRQMDRTCFDNSFRPMARIFLTPSAGAHSDRKALD